MERVDGIAKVTGTATYAGDIRPDAAADVAVLVTARRCGRVRVDAAAAITMPGVRRIVTHANAPRLQHPTALSGTELGARLPLQDDQVAYPGECVAIVVATTLVEARAAAAAMRISYADGPTDDPVTRLDAGEDRLKPVRRAGTVAGVIRRGQRRDRLPADAVVVEADYGTAPTHHNAMEPGAVFARWEEDGSLSIQAPVQWGGLASLVVAQTFGFGMADGLPGTLARMLGVTRHARGVRVAPTFAGGSFGRNNSELFLVLAAMAAKANERAVRLELSRRDTFSVMPCRGETRARIRLVADPQGRLTDLTARLDVAQGRVGAFVEPLGEGMAHVYACPNVDIRHRVGRLDLSATGWMRAPGNGPGMFALETALDELAVALAIDPLDLRLANYAEDDPQSGKRWSSKSLRACYEAGAAAIGWAERPKGGTRDGEGRLIGFGMASAIHLNRQFPASARVILDVDGKVIVETCTAEIGQGQLTALALIAAETLGVRPEAVAVRWNDALFPPGAPTFASTGTLSNGAAVQAAARKLRRSVLSLARRTVAGVRTTGSIDLVDGMIVAPGRRETLASVLAGARATPMVAEATNGRTLGMGRAPGAAFGAHFVAVSVDPATLATRVERMVGAFACGRIVNEPVLRGQLAGGMTWGIGQALMEESHPDPRSGAWVNDTLAEALVPTHADVPAVEVILIAEDDRANHPLGIKGGGEIGLVGAAAAIGNAIFDATGTRFRSAPMRPHDALTTADVHRAVTGGACRPSRSAAG